MKEAQRLITIIFFMLLVPVMNACGGETSSVDQEKSLLISTAIPRPTVWTILQTSPEHLLTTMEKSPPPEKEVVFYSKGENLAAVSLYLSNDWEAQGTMYIVAGVCNSGMSTQNDIVARFFLGDPQGGGTQIGDDIVIASLSPDSTVCDSVSWIGCPGSSQIFFIVDPGASIAEVDESDNVDSLFVCLCDSVPWVWQQINGFCNYAALAMLFNFYGAGHDVYETVELACCPHTMACQDDWLALSGGWILCQAQSDYEFAGFIRNLIAAIEVQGTWSDYLLALKSKIDAGIPFETSVDPYYLPQPDWDYLRANDIHSGHAAVVVGYTDSTVIIHDPGVGLAILDQPGIPHPENRGAFVVVSLDTFRWAVEQSLGTSYILISYAPAGPMPSRETMFLDALEKSLLRLAGDRNAFDPAWWPVFDVYGRSSFSCLQEDMDEQTFQKLFDDVMASTGGDLNDALNMLTSIFDMWGCQICWQGAAAHYGTLEYPQAAILRDLSDELSSVAGRISDTYADMLSAIYYAGGSLNMVGPYLSQMRLDLDEIIPLEDSVLSNLIDLYAQITEISEEPAASGQMPELQLICYPNPFNDGTAIVYSLARDGDVHVTVFNLLGQRVRTLLDDHQQADWYEVTWDGRDDGGYQVASGLYFCRLETCGLSKTVKMVLVR